MKRTIRSVSSVALVLGLAGGFQHALAQTPDTVVTTQPESDAPASRSADRVVVVGSLIATTPEDAAKPVEVFTSEELKEQGSPSMTEFVRSLTGASPNTNNMSGSTSGNLVISGGRQTIDLRGQGSDGTLILLNGRRLSAAAGGGVDVNVIPMEAIEAVDILKDGASATYGAGAVGGVINFRTRRDIDAPEITLSRTLYDGSDGAMKATLLTGWVGDNGNVMISGTYETEDTLSAVERSYANLPFAINPSGWSLNNTTARFHRYANWTTAQPTNLITGAGGGTVGAAFNDFTSNADCATIGGGLIGDLQPGGGATVPTQCAFTVTPWLDLVQEFTRYQVYGEANVDISDTMELHFDASYNKYDSTGNRPPGAPPIAARAMDGSVSATCSSTNCSYLIPFEQAVYSVTGQPTGTVVQNPFIADFNARQPGVANDVGPGMALLTSAAFRPYLFGGHPKYGYGAAQSHVQRERYQGTIGLKGEFRDTPFGGLFDGITYDYSGQYSQYVQTAIDNGDWLANRMQDAMMGYGGPDCNAIDRVATDYSSAAAFNRTIGIQSDTAPGTNGCLWYNPFQSNFATSSANGAVNPNFPTSGSPNWGAGATQAGSTGPAGFLNDPALIDWMWAERSSALTDSSLIFDALFTGEIPETTFSLPGGQIGWAAGAQWRLYERSGQIFAPDEEERKLLIQQCPYSHAGQAPQPPLPPGQPPTSRGCAGINGTGNFSSLSRPLTPGELITERVDFDSQVLAYFGEVSLPVLDNLNLSASVRREEFNGGKLNGNIWSVAGKWDITDNVYARASFGTNFRATDALNLRPGAESLTLGTDQIRFGPGYTFPTLTRVDTGIRPENAETFNIGVGYQGGLFDGYLVASVDYFGIEITDQVVTSLATQVLDNVFVDGAPGDGSPAHQADCAARLISLIQFSSGPCVQGVTTAANVSRVDSVIRNGPSFTTAGIDYALSYVHPLFGGDIAFSTTITQNLKFEAGAFEVNGIVFDPGGDRLGFRNTSQTGFPSQELRGNASIRWSNDEHSIGLRANYEDGFDLESNRTRVPILNLPGTANDVFSGYGWGKKDYVTYDLNYIYQVPYWQDLELRLSVLNITDRDPPPFQHFTGYDQLVGNPRGRMFRLEATKKF